MYIENNIIYADDYKVLYKRSTNSLVGKSAELLFTFWGANGERLANPQYEDESYFYEKFDVSEIREKKFSEIEEYISSNDINAIIFNDQSVSLSKERRASILEGANAKMIIGEKTINFWYEGSKITMPIEMVVEILVKWESYDYDVMVVKEGHIEAIKLLDDGDSIETYDYRFGYPEKLVFNYNFGNEEEAIEEPVEEVDEYIHDHRKK